MDCVDALIQNIAKVVVSERMTTTVRFIPLETIQRFPSSQRQLQIYKEVTNLSIYLFINLSFTIPSIHSLFSIPEFPPPFFHSPPYLPFHNPKRKTPLTLLITHQQTHTPSPSHESADRIPPPDSRPPPPAPPRPTTPNLLLSLTDSA